jgi:hypothetical protein
LTPPPKIAFTAAVCGLYLIPEALAEIPQTHGRVRLHQSGVLDVEPERSLKTEIEQLMDLALTVRDG